MAEERFLCPECGEPITTDAKECPCGWHTLNKEDIKDAVFGYLEDKLAEGVPPSKVPIPEIAEEMQLAGVPPAMISKLRRQFSATMRPPPPQYAQNPPSGPISGIPDWAIEPYRMQIDNLKEQVKNLNEKNTNLEKELREEVRKPREPNERYGELDKIVFDQMKENLKNGAKGGQPRSWVEELVTGMVQSGQLGTIATEAAGLLGDLRNKNNPDHDPYAKFYAEREARRRAQGQQQRRPGVPPANIKRVAQRPTPQGVQPQANPPAPEPEVVEAETVEPEADTSAENQEILAQFTAKYPDLADTVPTILTAIDAEQPGTPRAQKITMVVETLRVVAQLREIGVGVKGILTKTFTASQAAGFLIQKYPAQAKVLAEQGADAWLERGIQLFSDHPVHGKDIKFLQQPEAREAIDAIVAAIRKRLEAKT